MSLRLYKQSLKSLKLYNTLTRKVKEFTSIKPPRVGLYSCGPTVYSSPHIGNYRAYVFVDILRRVLEANGYQVRHVMNITDVGHLFEEGEEARVGEDKVEYEAKREGLSAWDIAKKYTEEFLRVLSELNIKRPHIMPKATEHIKEQIELIEKLESKGFTYTISDGVYFDTSKFKEYGKLAGGKEGIKPGARVEMVPGKKNPTDFALWKFSPRPDSGQAKRQMEWESPWAPPGVRVHPEGSPRGGKVLGFPGWHIECSAMSMRYLGEAFDPNGRLRVNGEHGRTIDIHTGGVDHIPVHHTNEIAQSVAATGKPFVRFWLHNEFVQVDGKKMSKSLGNLYTLSDIKAKGFEPLALRYLYFTAHYRDKINFTWESLDGAQKAYDRLKPVISGELSAGSRKALFPDKLGKIEDFRKKFMDAVNDDLNTPQGLAVVWEVVKSNIPSVDKRDLLLSFDEILGLNLAKAAKAGKVSKVPKEVLELVEKREALRKQEKWEEADKLRRKVEMLGFKIEDTKGGPRLKKK